MKEPLSRNTFLHPAKIPVFCKDIREKNILVQEIEFDYNRKKNMLISRVDGITDMSLTNRFLDSMENDLGNLHEEIILPLIHKYQTNFTLRLKVDSAGHFVLDKMKIIFKVNCKSSTSLHDKFRIPFRTFIPFTEYIDYISIRGHEYEVAVMEAEVNIHKLDLLDIFKNPIVGNKSKAQWYSFAVEAVEEASKDFKLDVVIPISEGEVTWEISHRRRIQQLDLVGR